MGWGCLGRGRCWGGVSLWGPRRGGVSGFLCGGVSGRMLHGGCPRGAPCEGGVRGAPRPRGDWERAGPGGRGCLGEGPAVWGVPSGWGEAIAEEGAWEVSAGDGVGGVWGKRTLE